MSNISKRDKQSSWLHRVVGLIRLFRSAPLAHREAERLARVMWRRTYREVAPDWQPLPDTAETELARMIDIVAEQGREITKLRDALWEIASIGQCGEESGDTILEIRAITHRALSLPNAPYQPHGGNEATLPVQPTK